MRCSLNKWLSFYIQHFHTHFLDRKFWNSHSNLKNIERRTAHTIVSWPNPKQWVIVHTSDLMMIIRQSIYIFSQLSQRKWVNWKHTAHWVYSCKFTWYRKSKLVLLMTWCWSGDKPISNQKLTKLTTYDIITVQWVIANFTPHTSDIFIPHFGPPPYCIFLSPVYWH